MSTSKTKKALIGSAGALVLCFALLLGTTFAWFTDNATTSVNKIQAGNLDVALQMESADGEWVNAEGETLQFKTADGRSEGILWEPGATYELPALRIVNQGDLALKYKVEITGIDGDAKLNEAIDWYYSVDLASVIPGATGWTTPTDAYKLENFGEEDFLYPEGIAANARTHEQVFKIIGVMNPEAGNEYKGLSIDGISITVMATQYAYEYDSNSNQYDAGATYAITSLSDINDAIKGGAKNLFFDKDVSVNVEENDSWSAIKVNPSKGANEVVNLDGTGSVKSDKFVIWSTSGATVNINGGTYETTGNTHLIYVNDGGKVVINGGKFIAPATGEQMFNMANTAKGGQIIIKGGLYSRNPSTQIAGNDEWKDTTGLGIKIEDGYKVVEKDIDGTTWYEVVPE